MAQVVCPSCGAKNSPRSKECWNCKTAVGPDWEREPGSVGGNIGRGLLITLAVIVILIGVCIAVSFATM